MMKDWAKTICTQEKTRRQPKESREATEGNAVAYNMLFTLRWADLKET